MQLAITGLRNYALLPWGTLIVDPDPDLLNARVRLLMAATQYVALRTNAADIKELCGVEVSVAILSQTLGCEPLTMLAQRVRFTWPNAFILLLGTAPLTLEGWLYDDAIDASCRPDELLLRLHLLDRKPKDPEMKTRIKVGSHPFGLARSGWMQLPSVPRESDPTKEIDPILEKGRTGRDEPADERLRDTDAPLKPRGL